MSAFGLIVPLQVPVGLGRDEAQRLAAAELAKAKYGGLPDWVVRLMELIRRIITALARSIFLSGSASTGVRPVVIVVAVLLVLAVAVIVWRVGLPRWSHRHRVDEVTVDPTRTPDSYRTQADEAAAAGDFRAAIGDRFRAVVRELEERTILDPRPARTATEVARSAGAVLRDHRPALDRTAALFNDTWYGDRIAGPDGYTELCALDAELTRAADEVDLGDLDETSTSVSAGGRR